MNIAKKLAAGLLALLMFASVLIVCSESEKSQVSLNDCSAENFRETLDRIRKNNTAGIELFLIHCEIPFVV